MTAPQFDGCPVILVHMAVRKEGKGSRLTACSGDEFNPPLDDRYVHTPRVLCPGCFMAQQSGFAAVSVEKND